MLTYLLRTTYLAGPVSTKIPKPSTSKSETALDVDEAVINASYSDASDEIPIFANLVSCTQNDDCEASDDENYNEDKDISLPRSLRQINVNDKVSLK